MIAVLQTEQDLHLLSVVVVVEMKKEFEVVVEAVQILAAAAAVVVGILHFHRQELIDAEVAASSSVAAVTPLFH